MELRANFITMCVLDIMTLMPGKAVFWFMMKETKNERNALDIYLRLVCENVDKGCDRDNLLVRAILIMTYYVFLNGHQRLRESPIPYLVARHSYK